MDGVLYRLLLIAGIGIFSATATTGFAQSKATGKQTANYNPYSTARENRRLLSQSLRIERDYGQIPNQLVLASHDSFHRGLMPLDDHLWNLAFAREAQLARPDLDEAGKIQIWTEYRNQIEFVSASLASLYEPAAKNWGSENAFAAYSLANAEVQLAQLQGNDSASALARQQATDAILVLAAQREFDYSLGLATLDELVIAHDRVAKELELPKSFRDQLWLAAEQEKHLWNAVGAGIGRSDEVVEIAMVRQTIELQQSLESGNLDKIRDNLQAAGQTSENHFAVLSQFHQHGTATLSDLSRALTFRNRLVSLEKSIPELGQTLNQNRFHSDWNSLKSIADSTDRVGRHQADVLAVEILGIGINEKR